MSSKDFCDVCNKEIEWTSVYSIVAYKDDSFHRYIEPMLCKKCFKKNIKALKEIKR